MELLNKFSFPVVARKLCSCFLMMVRFAFLAAAFLCCSNVTYAQTPVKILYPVYHSDTDRIIAEIRDGIHESLGNGINEWAFDPARNNISIQKKMVALSKESTVITLTEDLGNFVRSSGFKGRLIEGASDHPLITRSTVSAGIEPSPEIYVESLIKLNPEIKQVFYFTLSNGNKSEGEKEADRLRNIARDNGISLKFVSIININDAMHNINEVITKYDPAMTAMWVPNRILSMSSNTVLKYVLRESWKRSFIVFTDSLDAVARGLLFSLIPDYKAYGEFLGQLALDIPGHNDPPVFESLRYFDDVYLMLNQRFAVHIGLNINRSVFQKYKIVVPAK